MHWWDPFLIAAVIVVSYIQFYEKNYTTVELVLILSGILTVVMVPIEYWRSPMRKIARPNIPLLKTLKSVAKKSVVIYLLVGCVLLAWNLIFEYRRSEYDPFFEAMPYILPSLPVVIFFWILWTEWRLGPANDYVAQLAEEFSKAIRSPIAA